MGRLSRKMRGGGTAARDQGHDFGPQSSISRGTFVRAPHVTTIRSGRLSVAVLLAVTLALSLLVLVVPGADAARNRPPKLNAIGTKTVAVGQVLTVRPKASDPDRGPKKLRFSAKGRPSWLALNAKTGVLKGR